MAHSQFWGLGSPGARCWHLPGVSGGRRERPFRQSTLTQGFCSSSVTEGRTVCHPAHLPLAEGEGPLFPRPLRPPAVTWAAESHSEAPRHWLPPSPPALETGCLRQGCCGLCTPPGLSTLSSSGDSGSATTERPLWSGPYWPSLASRYPSPRPREAPPPTCLGAVCPSSSCPALHAPWCQSVLVWCCPLSPGAGSGHPSLSLSLSLLTLPGVFLR